MMQPTTLLPSFQGLVGWRKPDDTDLQYTQDADQAYLYASDSGYYFNDVSHLVRLEYLDKVRLEEEELEEYINRLTNAAILDTLDQYYRQRLRSTYAKTLLSPEPVVNGAGYYRDTVIGQNRFVGFQITLKDHRSLSVHLSKVSLQLTAPQAVPLKLYLYEAGMIQPRATLDLAYTSANSVHWYDVKGLNEQQDIYLQRDLMGLYYLGYYEEDLDGSAIKKDYDGLFCGHCRSYSKQLNEYVSVVPISVPAAFFDVSRDLFDPSQVVSEGNNAGLNVQLSVYCDLTNVLNRERMLFAKAIQLKGAIKALNDMFTTPETSRLAMTEVKQDAYAQAQELIPEYEAVIKDITLEFSGLDSACYPSDTRQISVQHIAR